MHILPNKPKILNLLVFIVLSSIYLSCSKDDDSIPSADDESEIKLGAKTADTILFATVDNYKIPVYLSIPKDCGNVSLPAVVVLHGSDGMWTNHDPSTGTMSGQNNEWRALFDADCIVGAYVDSYSERGVTTRTGKWTTAPDNFKISSQFVRPKDAYAALSLLKRLRFANGKSVIRPKDIALLGFSDGASAVAATLYNTATTPKDWKWSQSFDGKKYDTSSGVLPPDPNANNGFAGGVFYYGGSGGYDYWGANVCGTNAMEGNIYRTYAPILYQIPQDGYLTENTLCMYNVLKEKGDPVELNLYEGVGHGFDFDHLPQSYEARSKAMDWFRDLLHIIP
ncbi:dienelactone hydrolase family protein [Allomuricauda sp. M10]|uniref:dienelactone hydrolase family protein n=1 Tax=Allomuricauda sp. M10 TaxID=2683292 RepID=UPI001D17EED2|nr:alpha/beta hydrolase [Muricauda sp. M10]